MDARPARGITFHDGTPFDGEAVRANLERMRTSPLVGGAFRYISSVELQPDDSVVVTVDRPWSHFPLFLAGQPGYQGSPTWMAAVDAGTAESTEPVGTGPFVFSDYNPDDNLVVTRNPEYWLEAPTGSPTRTWTRSSSWSRARTRPGPRR